METQIRSGEPRDEGSARYLGLVARFERSSLLLNVVLLAILLVVVLPLVSASEVWSSDEGAIRLQASTIASGNGWQLERPFHGIDPEEVTSPIQASTVDGDRYAPFTKHPFTPLVVAAMPGAGGGWAAVVPSIAGSVAAATVIAMIAGWLHAPARNHALWAAGIATPLFFYSFTVLHHTIAVAAAAAATAGALAWLRGGSSLALTISLLAVFVLPWLRREGILFGVAIAVAVGIIRGRERFQRGLLVATAYIGMVGFGVLLNDSVSKLLGGRSSVVEGDRGFWSLERVVGGLAEGLVGLESLATWSAVFVIAFVLGTVLMCHTIASRPEDSRRLGVLAVVIAAGGVGLLITMGPRLSGAIVAMPWLFGAMFMVSKKEMKEQSFRFLSLLGALYVGAVILTQERHAGGAGWGGRYLMLALPALVPVAMSVLRRRIAELEIVGRRWVGVAAVWVVVVSVVLAVGILDQGRAKVEIANEQWAAFASEVGTDGIHDAPVMLSPDSQLGRFGWKQIESIHFFMIPSHLERYVDRYLLEEPSAFVYMGDWDAEIQQLFSSRGYVASDEPDSSGSVVLTAVAPEG